MDLDRNGPHGEGHRRGHRALLHQRGIGLRERVVAAGKIARKGAIAIGDRQQPSRLDGEHLVRHAHFSRVLHAIITVVDEDRSAQAAAVVAKVRDGEGEHIVRIAIAVVCHQVIGRIPIAHHRIVAGREAVDRGGAAGLRKAGDELLRLIEDRELRAGIEEELRIAHVAYGHRSARGACTGTRGAQDLHRRPTWRHRPKDGLVGDARASVRVSDLNGHRGARWHPEVDEVGITLRIEAIGRRVVGVRRCASNAPFNDLHLPAHASIAAAMAILRIRSWRQDGNTNIPCPRGLIRIGIRHGNGVVARQQVVDVRRGGAIAPCERVGRRAAPNLDHYSSCGRTAGGRVHQSGAHADRVREKRREGQ